MKSGKLELQPILNDLENFLKGKDEFEGPEDLGILYSTVHTINESGKMYGLNSLIVLFAPIESYLSDLKEKGIRLEKNKSAIMLSSISMAFAIIDDPSLSVAGLRNNFETIKKQVLENFKKENADDNLFSNNRFQEIFIEEANDLINQLEEKLLQLESEPNDTKLVDNVFRIMHTLKGNSNMFGFKHLGEITHHLENIYDAIRSHKLDVNRSILDITLQCIDHFRNLIEDQYLAEQSNKLIQETILNEIVEILDTDHHKEIDAVKEEQHEYSTGIKTFYIFFKPHANVLDDGSNPLYFISDLYELGECKVVPVTAGIPKDETFNVQRCYTGWHVLLATNEQKETLAENFMFLHEASQPEILFLANDNLIRNVNFITDFLKQAASEKSISSWLNEHSGINGKSEEKKVISSTTVDSSVASIRVASAKIDLMMNLISELVTKQAELSMVAGNNDIPQLQALAESIESISRDLRDNAFSISLIPLEKSVLRFQRLVRDVSAKFNKKVNFVIEGKETELDKTIIEKIVDPIMHILRNSIDHGIETPDIRKKLGKSEYGTITLKAYPSGAHVIIEISDDGSGINMEKVRAAAIRKGYINAADEFSKAEMLKLILSPGFSTAENVSEVSGRGVGMDVVCQKLNEIRGELDVQTEANVGTTMTIKLPLTISIIDSLLVMAGSTYFLIPLSVVERCAEISTELITGSSTNYINLNNVFIPFIDLHNEFEVEEERLDYQRLILVNHKKITVALVVDQILGNYQAVLKSLGYAYRRQEIVSGASILGNGEVALVLDTNKIIQEYMANNEMRVDAISSVNMQIS